MRRKGAYEKRGLSIQQKREKFAVLRRPRFEITAKTTHVKRRYISIKRKRDKIEQGGEDTWGTDVESLSGKKVASSRVQAAKAKRRRGEETFTKRGSANDRLVFT